jgi:asparagine synthase (glutamine-hydrolysing)
MCGFAGIIEKLPGTLNGSTGLLRGLGATLAHRGPNEEGVFKGKRFAVVHRRLSIIDIAQGHQPMVTAGGRVGIAYNGEVYNYKQLRQDLEKRGHTFETNCDTEVVLKIFVEHGPGGFTLLDGMFAAFIWDTREREDGVFYLVRDHLGIKPLYIYEDAERLLFSSELRPLLSVPGLDLSLNPVGLQSYLTFRYCHAPETLYDRIHRLEAGSYWRINGSRVFRNRFWDLEFPEHPQFISEREASERFFTLLRDSVKAQQMSEVPVGLLLSGGVDSATLACLCREIGVQLKSFNVGFPTVNEFPYSREVAESFGLDHVTVETTPKEIVNSFPAVVEAMDEPIADPACFPLHILCGEIKKSVTVVLSGEGSDELLGGYPQYQAVAGSEPLPLYEQFQRFLRASWYFADDRPPLAIPVDRARLWRHRSYFAENLLLNGMLAYDLKTWLPEDLMMKADKILMSHSLEGRFPFLSKPVVEFLCSLPENLKLNGGTGKVLLRRTFSRRLPKRILERPKMGFSVPLDLLNNALKDRTYDLVTSLERHEIGTILDLAVIRKRFDVYFSGRDSEALWVWTVLVLLHWFDLKLRLPSVPSDRVATAVGSYAM